MAQEAIRQANKMARSTISNIDAAYGDVVRSALKKHRKTLEKLEELKAEGKHGAARALFRSSGLLGLLVEAMAAAGKEAAALIQKQSNHIIEVMDHDDGL